MEHYDELMELIAEECVSVNGKILLLNQLFSIDESDITSEFAKQASIYAYLGVLAAKAEDAAAKAAAAKDREYAMADQYYRTTFETEGKKFTEASIKAAIMTDESYNAVCDEYMAKRYEADVLKSMVRAMDQRAEMLISLGSHLRHEADMTGMNIRESAYNDSIRDVKNALNQRKAK